MIPLHIRLLGAVAALLLAFSTGWLVKGWQVDANALNAYQQAVKHGNDLGDKLDKVLVKLEENKFIVQKEVRHETTKQIYSDCVLPDSGIRLFNQSANGSSSQP